MAKKEKYIKLDKDKVKEIADIKGVSTVTVYAALKFQTDSALAMLIRPNRLLLKLLLTY